MSLSYIWRNITRLYHTLHRSLQKASLFSADPDASLIPVENQHTSEHRRTDCDRIFWVYALTPRQTIRSATYTRADENFVVEIQVRKFRRATFVYGYYKSDICTPSRQVATFRATCPAVFEFHLLPFLLSFFSLLRESYPTKAIIFSILLISGRRFRAIIRQFYLFPFSFLLFFCLLFIVNNFVEPSRLYFPI